MILNWDSHCKGETFKKCYAKYLDSVKEFDLDPSLRPIKQVISQTVKYLNYKPRYSLMNALQDLVKYNEKEPSVKYQV